MRALLPKAKYTFRQIDQRGGSLRAWTTKKPELKTGIVCERNCNNGWMSDLEGRMKAATEDIIMRSVSKRFTVKECEAITAWGFKTTVLANHTDLGGREPFFSEAERYAFAKTQVIPSGIHAWVAQRDARGHVTGMYRSIQRTLAPSKRDRFGNLSPAVSPYRFQVYTCTFSIGYLIVQVVATRWTNRKVRKRLQPLPVKQAQVFDQHAIAIWPNNGFSVLWPPLVPIGNDLMEIYWDRFERFELPAWMCWLAVAFGHNPTYPWIAGCPMRSNAWERKPPSRGIDRDPPSFSDAVHHPMWLTSPAREAGERT